MVTALRRLQALLIGFAEKHIRLQLTIALLVLLSITTWMVRKTTSDFKTSLAHSLPLVLDTTNEALNLWVKSQLNTVTHTAVLPEVRVLARQVASSPGNQAALLKLKITLEQAMQMRSNDHELSLIGPGNLNLFSTEESSVGRTSLLIAQPDVLARLWAGEAVMSRPLRRPSQPVDQNGSPPERLIIYAGAPVRDDSGKISALILLGINPQAELSPLFYPARQSTKTGESYIFDRKGWFLSESRFLPQLKAARLVHAKQQTTLNLDLRDPGVDLTSGEHPPLRELQPLTRMAMSAVRGERGVDVNGYRNYRGVPVVGAWMWNHDLAMGVAVESEVAESFQPLYTTRRTLIAFAGFIGLLLVAIVAFDERSRRRLAHSQTRLESLVNTLSDGVVVIDQKGNVESINPAMVRLFGYQPDELVGKHFSSLMPELERNNFDNYLRRFTTGPDCPMIGFDREEVSVQGKNAIRLFVDISVREMHLQGKLYFTGILRDISKRRVATEHLKALNVQLLLMALVAQKTESAVTIADRDGEILWVNDAFTKITEYTLDDVIGRRPGSFLHGADTDRNTVKRIGNALRAGRAVREEILNYSKSGRPYWAQLQITPVFDDEDAITRYVALAADVTERHRSVLQLLTAKEAAEEGSRAKSAFLATMSHEIRTPMNGVVGLIDVLRHTQLTDDQRSLVASVKESAFALLTLIDDILDLSKIEAGRLQLERVPVAIGKLVENIADSVLPMALGKGIELLIHYDPRTPSVYADAARLRQILFNLLGNAIKFTGNDRSKAGRVVVSAEYRSLPENQIELRLHVQDNGIGMSSETQTRLFQPFVQGESSTTRRFGGTGLGLTICRRLADIMGGAITMASEEGSGSTFSVSLTCELAAEEQPPQPFDLSGVRVLLLNPNRGDVPGLILERYLNATNAAVVFASDEEDATRVICDPAHEKDKFVVVIDKHRDPVFAGAMRQHIRERAAGTNPRFVMVARGRRRGVRQETDDTVTVDLDAMRAETLLHAVAVAAGRASPISPVPADTPYREDFLLAGEPQTDGPLILVAEDNETNQKVFGYQIRMLGHRCEIVDNGRVALERWRQGDYALLLTDCHMPEMDGYELTGAIRKEEGENRRTPIIAITADALKGTKEECLATGMDDYLPKPIQLKELKEILDQWLPKAPTQQGPQGAAETISHDAPPWSPTGTPVAASTAPVGRNPEREPPAKAGAGDEGSEIEAVDPNALKEVLGIDDQAMLLDFYSDFLRTGEDSVSSLRAAYDNRQSGEVGALAHRLKSSARMVGAHALADCCLVLEKAGKSDDWPVIDENITALPNYFDGVKSWIKDFSDHLSER